MNYEEAVEMAHDLILSHGEDPEYLSISETVGDWADENLLAEDEVEAATQLVSNLIQAAEITVEFPNEDDLK